MELLELTGDHEVRQLVASREVRVAGRLARQLALQVAAEDIGSSDARLVFQRVGMACRHQHHDAVLHALAESHHARLPITELGAVLEHRVRDFERELRTLRQGVLDMLGQPSIHSLQRRLLAKTLEEGFDIPEREGWCRGQALVQRLELTLDVLLAQSQEELHVEHVVLPFVDARRQVVVQVGPDDVVAQEGATAVDHQGDVDGRFLECICREGLGDDALQLGRFAVVQHDRAPVAQSVGADDQCCQTSDPRLDTLARFNALTVGLAVVGPGADAPQQQPLDPGAVGGNRDTTEVETDVDQAQAVAVRRDDPVCGGHAELVELQSVVATLTDSQDLVANELEMLVLLRQLDDELGGLLLSVDHDDQPNDTAGHAVSVEELLAAYHVIITIAVGGGFDFHDVGAGAGLSQGQTGGVQSGGEERQIARLLLLAAIARQRADSADATVHPRDSGLGGKPGGRHARDDGGELSEAGTAATVGGGNQHAPEAGPTEVVHRFLSDLAVLAVEAAVRLVALQAGNRVGKHLFQRRGERGVVGDEGADFSVAPDRFLNGSAVCPGELAEEVLGRKTIRLILALVVHSEISVSAQQTVATEQQPFAH